MPPSRTVFLEMSGAQTSSGAARTRGVDREVRAPSDGFVSSDALAQTYDWCAVQRFDYYRRSFAMIDWTFTALVVTLSVISGASGAPSLFGSDDESTRDVLALVSIGTGLLSAIFAAVAHLSNFRVRAEECRYARAEIAFYLTEPQPMPRHVFHRIATISLLCFSHPKKCERRQW